MDEKKLLIDKKRDSLNRANEAKHQSSRLEWAEVISASMGSSFLVSHGSFQFSNPVTNEY